MGVERPVCVRVGETCGQRRTCPRAWTGALWIAQGNDAAGWDANERAQIDAADEMYRDTMISDETWGRLSERYDTHRLMSIAATVTRYRKVSMTLNAFRVQPLPDDERFPVPNGP